MNTPASASLRFSRALARSQLSPISRRALRTLPSGGAARSDATPERASTPSTAIDAPNWSALTPPTPAPLGAWWDPHLLDRLQAPLSRIRE